MLMSAVSFGVQSYAREQLTSDQSSFIESTTTDSLSTVLAEFAKIKPTLHKNQGDPINILVARDVDLSPVYQLRRRAMAADTARHLLHDILGPIRPILAREDVTDLCINGPGLLFVEGAHGWERIQADNLTGTWLQRLRQGGGELHVREHQRALADPERASADRGADSDRPAAGGRGAVDHDPPAEACDLQPG